MEPIKANPLSLEIEYAIRDVIIPAMELEKKGHRILKLNIGDPNKYDFDTPQFIKDSVKEAIDLGLNGYAPSSGLPQLVEAIRTDERSKGNSIEEKDIIVTHGVTEALQLIFYASLSPGDEVLVPGPSYPPYITYVNMVGAKAVPYRTIEEDGWIPDVEDIRSKMGPRTKAVSIINPNNPTGALYNEKIIKDIGDVVGEHGKSFLISDEIYDLMTFEEETPSTANTNKDLPVITMNGISKIYLAPGWRVGYMSIRDPHDQLVQIRDGIERQSRARLCANSICEYGFYKALTGNRSHVNGTMSKLRKRRDIAYKRLNEIEGTSTQRPGGAFYMFPKIDCIKEGPWKSDREFSLDLLKEEKVLTVFGSGFGKEYGSDHFRIVILPREEVLNEAFDGIERLIRKRLL
ncbi:MAG: aminotransferase class I/II-fold pyridoxal phosphate-dependent enzyme [Candidatus Thermoplasmatota archaeon]|nr:aminotransferase class I/II-fold pyridoxal phosphate-dependent enzyme [Candidatus Thermoplasmatota archaeon]